ncbi:UDP-4-amino-4,6-dideoxy-N-acetyl-beta-L-altrosamine transaminase [Sphingomonas leidyi]|uniref:UDP-4-amino-4, 6-dideoxy-N-acetyl-beta-L-altrosamine transaminase n=1 Tax=Sphingomonas leidyi TaxID=68569 RepID=A0A7X5UWV9_9SPHN|nr:UDP-4-amino-4,6-dideoxy-N-acetyl-beta-L-altrosamine transaminase [Sphingomonas leidyi]NIJ63638.1 UDP-4-amino-4,6-dideoxy-N-acetyl-beta-L-altrosamine transaminase [Sphingomonas leidyi]
MDFIPYGRQHITDEDIAAVTAVLKSDFLTQGPCVPAFEQALAAYCGAARAVAVNSATSALHIACLALGLGEGDWLWTTPITFVASSNCALYCGARVDFVDIDPTTCNISVEALAAKLERAERQGRLPKIVVPVHLSGQSCDMAAIRALADRYGFKLIEDASHAVGGRYRGKPVGSCEFSDITIFSFHPVKIVTTAEGGAALTNDPVLARRMELLRSHGITREAAEMTHASDGPWYYQQIDLGFNYRLTELQAALGLSQLARIDEYVAGRHRIAARYDALLAEFPVIVPHNIPESYSGLHLYVVQIDTDRTNRDHRTVFEALRNDGIGVNLHYIPVHLQPYYRAFGFQPGDFPAAERYYSRAISIPMYPQLDDEAVERVVASLGRALRG